MGEESWDCWAPEGDLANQGPGKSSPRLNNIPSFTSFPCGSAGKESACNAGDLGLIPGLGRFPGEGNGYPLQYFCLENSKDRGAWWATVHGSQRDTTEHTYAHTFRWPGRRRKMGVWVEGGKMEEPLEYSIASYIHICDCIQSVLPHHSKKAFQVWQA